MLHKSDLIIELLYLGSIELYTILPILLLNQRNQRNILHIGNNLIWRRECISDFSHLLSNNTLGKRNSETWEILINLCNLSINWWSNLSK